MKQPNTHPFGLIGERLRSEWREIETAPLPARIGMLLEQLRQREPSGQAHRWAIPVSDAATCLEAGEGLEANAAPISGSRRRVLAEA